MASSAQSNLMTLNRTAVCNRVDMMRLTSCFLKVLPTDGTPNSHFFLASSSQIGHGHFGPLVMRSISSLVPKYGNMGTVSSAWIMVPGGNLSVKRLVGSTAFLPVLVTAFVMQSAALGSRLQDFTLKALLVFKQLFAFGLTILLRDFKVGFRL